MGTAPGDGVLVVAALHEEVAHVTGDVEVVVTGVGKARAAAALAHRLAAPTPPRLVVNIGTAGAVTSGLSGVVEIGYVTQHDFPYDAMELLLSRPVERGFALHAGRPPAPVRLPPDGVTAVATGDVFVSDPSSAARIAAGGVHLVDMEAYAYAAACAEFGVPFRCAKAVSDAADEDAGLSWLDSIDACARALAEWTVTRVLGG
jgi:adenosylhomocysteine nucleosidase